MNKLFVVAGSVGFTVLQGCAMSADTADIDSTASVAQAASSVAGEKFFNQALPHTNGRSCGTCHVAAEHLALSPANVEARFAANPGEMLFKAIDADVPSAQPLTFNNLRQGVVRVKIRLPDNVDLLQVPPTALAFAPSGAVQAWWTANRP